jgi:hypothetical protein
LKQCITAPLHPYSSYPTSASHSCLFALCPHQASSQHRRCDNLADVRPTMYTCSFHLVATCTSTVPLVNGDTGTLEHLIAGMRSASPHFPLYLVAWHSRAGSLALSGLLAHAGHTLASLRCSTTSKTLHRVPRISVSSPNREAFPISENESPGIASPVLESRGQSARVLLGSRSALSGKRLSTSVTADRVRVGRRGPKCAIVCCDLDSLIPP